MVQNEQAGKTKALWYNGFMLALDFGRREQIPRKGSLKRKTVGSNGTK
jgi:hypothetical protein